MGNWQWAIGNGQLAIGNGQLAIGNGQWAMANGQWPMGNSRRGTILVAVLVVLAIGALAAGALIYRAQAEITASTAGGRAQQAYATASSGLDFAIAVLKTYKQDARVWYDNPELFRGRLVCDDGANKWYYTIYADSPEVGSAASHAELLRYGVTDEASRININTAPASVLGALPNMTPDLVDCLMDWRDADGNSRQQGAEQDYYDRLPVPYNVHNGPLASPDEVLMIRGFTGHTLYGEDYNLNGMLERNEDDGDTLFPPDNADGKLDRGLAGVATVYSYEMNVSSAGARRVNINTMGVRPPGSPGGRDGNAPAGRGAGDGGTADAGGDGGGNAADAGGDSGSGGGGGSSGRSGRAARDFTGGDSGMGDTGGGNRLDRLRDRPGAQDTTADGAEGTLSGQTALFIGLYAADGNSIKHPSELLEMRYQLKKDYGPLRAGTWVESGVKASDMAMLLDRYTAASGGTVAGLVNVNTAPVDVLAALPGMGADLARQVIDRRGSLTPEQMATPAWLIENDVLSVEQFKVVAPYLTTRGSQFRVRVVGYGWPCGQYRVLEAVVDVATGSPRVVYQRDLTALGMPLSIKMDQEVKR